MSRHKRIFGLALVLIQAYCLASEAERVDPAIAKPANHFDRSTIAIGAGFGIPYGGYGVLLELNMADMIGICAGLGYAGNQLIGFSVGTRIYPTGLRWRLGPFISAHYGTVAIVQYYNYSGRWNRSVSTEYQMGITAGAGIRYLSKRQRFSLTLQLLNVFSESPEIRGLRLAAGFQFHIRDIHSSGEAH